MNNYKLIELETEGDVSFLRLNQWNATDDPWVLAQERKNQMVAERAADCQEGVKAFHEKRPAQFVSR
jgi:hypothetical protein